MEACVPPDITVESILITDILKMPSVSAGLCVKCFYTGFNTDLLIVTLVKSHDKNHVTNKYFHDNKKFCHICTVLFQLI